jgi:hypothetical protein
MLHQARLDPFDLRRWLLAYWCFYDSGTASWISDDPRAFWGRMAEAAGSKDYPRAHERRHFRGALATSSVDWLGERGLEALFEDEAVPLLSEEPAESEDVIQFVGTWRGFGPWIAFKVADMVERLGLRPVRFNRSALVLFDSPAKGAEMAWQLYGSGPEPSNKTNWAVDLILKTLGPVKAPPRYERSINVQEAETILCKFKSYRNGKYHVGEDITALRRSLLRFSRCRTAQRLFRAGREAHLYA